ncbi:hypothetical protein AWB80_02913 [Caballeronia pedi]|uniref:Uncharacterized protein n=1 Tax=Caballeronia pedi TaxID=1777141 RepID=A0A158B0Z9_9BURK|nr:hypothetical protein AWB80_02913 [Caballeronia pedi]
MTKGSVTLGEVAARSTHIEMACSRCDRRGRYRLVKLVASLGDDFPMTDLGAAIANCPRRHATVTERCDVYFPGLIKIMDSQP